jgi:hypothetical protein
MITFTLRARRRRSLLNELGAGASQRASADLLPLVYEQLRALAGDAAAAGPDAGHRFSYTRLTCGWWMARRCNIGELGEPLAFFRGRGRIHALDPGGQRPALGTARARR